MQARSSRLLHFNSIKVRLNLRKPTLSFGVPIFQFHKGTIKPGEPDTLDETAFTFQFHKGTIKPQLASGNLNPVSLFQFHKGTIKPLRMLLLS